MTTTPTESPPLSPVAQEVINAAAQELLKNPGSISLQAISAAALRAVALQLGGPTQMLSKDRAATIRYILAVVDELSDDESDQP